MDAYLNLQRWWAHTGAKIVSTQTPDRRISELASRYEIRLPDDFKRYLRFSTPIGETWDAQLGTWWDFDRIRTIPEEYPHELAPEIHLRAPKYLFFLDHCAWCWAWAISCADDETNSQVLLIAGDGYDKIVANTFSDFVHKYLSDWSSVC